MPHENPNYEQSAEALSAQGADPAAFLSASPMVAERMGPERASEVIERLTHFALELHAGGLSLTSPFAYGVVPLSKVFAGSPDEFLSCIQDLAAITNDLGEGADRTVQRGIPWVCEFGENRAWLVEAAVGLARDLSAVGIDPGETLLHSIETLAETVGDDRELFTTWLDAIRRFIVALDERGVHATYPIQQGLSATVAAWSANPAGLPDALDDLRDLVYALLDGDISPYGVLEYGVAPCFQSSSLTEQLRSEALPLAATLGAEGINPILALSPGFEGLAGMPPEYGRAALTWAQSAASDGVDPGWFLAYNANWVADTCADAAAFAQTLQGVDALARAITKHDHQPMLTFEEGLPQLTGRLDLDRVLTIATTMALQGTDPGPPIKFGFATLAHVADGRPGVAAAALSMAEALVEDGRSPWRMLEYGVPAALGVAGSDDEVAEEQLRALDQLLTNLHAKDVETDDLLLYGIYPLSREAQGESALFSTLLSLLDQLAADLGAANISPIHTVGSGLPAVLKAAQGDLGRLRDATAFASELASKGIDPAPFLVQTIPAIGHDNLAEVVALANAVHQSGFSTEPLGKAVAALSDAEVSSRSSALGVARDLARDGVDPTPALASCIPALLEACEPAALVEALDTLAEAMRALRAQPLSDPAVEERAFTAAIRVAQGQPHAMEESLRDAMEAVALVGAESSKLLSAFLFDAPDTAARASGQRRTEFGRIIRSLAEWAVANSAAPGIETVLRRGIGAAAEMDGGEANALPDLLPRLAALASLENAGQLYASGLRIAKLGADRDPARLAQGLDDLHRIGANDSQSELLQRIERLIPLVRKLPNAWSALIVPVCLGVGAGAPLVLDSVYYLESYLVEDDDLGLVREIVTQQGLRAPDVLVSLLLAGLRQGQISSIARHREYIQSFLREVPFTDPDYYAAYYRIMTDPELSPSDRRDRVKGLEADLASIIASVVSGEVTAAEGKHPLFPQVLSYVFPPSRNASRRDYLRLYESLSDRPADLENLAERGALPPGDVLLPTGGYRIRDGHRIDDAPWQPLLRAVVNERRQGTSGAATVELAALGQSLFDAWIGGDLGKVQTQDELLNRIYRRHCEVAPALPDMLEDAGALLKHREFLSDTALEIIQDALTAFRSQDPVRYERMAQAKLAPRRHIGKGLLRGVARTCEAQRQGEIDRDTAKDRLERQLRGFDLDVEGALDRLLSADKSSLTQVIESLPTVEETVALGEEHQRVLGDLVGTELAAMGRELFGGSGVNGKVEYSPDSGGPALALRFEPTKRRAHVPIGLCEGVCTAVDVRLWETPTFLQCVFWGPEDRAKGGMHLLRVERTVNGVPQRALALPGINPTLELLREVGPDAILDAALDYAAALARAWQLDEVWIPKHSAIATNRGPIWQVLSERTFTERQVTKVQFSYSPYGYSFQEVWVIPL